LKSVNLNSRRVIFQLKQGSGKGTAVQIKQFPNVWFVILLLSFVDVTLKFVHVHEVPVFA